MNSALIHRGGFSIVAQAHKTDFLCVCALSARGLTPLFSPALIKNNSFRLVISLTFRDEVINFPVYSLADNKYHHEQVEPFSRTLSWNYYAMALSFLLNAVLAVILLLSFTPACARARACVDTMGFNNQADRSPQHTNVIPKNRASLNV